MHYRRACATSRRLSNGALRCKCRACPISEWGNAERPNQGRENPFDTSIDQAAIARPIITGDNFNLLDDEWIRQTDEEVGVVGFGSDDDDDDADCTIVTSQDELKANDGE